MILSAHQPAYLPWLGYFDKIIRSDLFIYLDSVQYEKNGFINRNRIKTPQGPLWLTIPVKTKGHIGLTIREMEIDNTIRWQKKHLNSIYANYKKAPRFEECYEKLEVLYSKQYIYLSDLCWDHMKFWMKEIGIVKRLVRSSELHCKGKKSNLILDLCKYFGAKQYLSGILGKGYLDDVDFLRNGIIIEYQNYEYPVYPQLWGEFTPCMSIVDFWMNTNLYCLITGGK